MFKCVEQFSKRREHSSYDSTIVVLMSHGNHGAIYGIDEEQVSISSLAELFNPSNCFALAEKPKIFIIQACRGSKLIFSAQLLLK